MIYFTNTKLDKPHLTFIGRWTPFHNGHKTIIETKRKELPGDPILIQVRATNFDDYPAEVRAQFIKTWMIENNIEGTIMIVPDIKGVYYGRGVGYKIEEIKVPKEIEDISATKIRAGIAGKGKKDWSKDVASGTIANLLNPRVAEIIYKGHVIWLTGNPCAGKSTIAKGLEEKIKTAFPQLKVQMLDGDIARSTPLAENVGFSPEDRAKHIRRMGHLAKMFADHGILVIAAFVSPSRDVRNEVRDDIGEGRFSEVFVDASKKERIKRDVKGMYAKAKAGEIKNFTGYDAPYEEPELPSVVCKTDKEPVEKSVEKVFGVIFGN